MPQPALPQTRVGRPRGSPPPVISSSPSMPVAALGSERLFELWLIAALLMTSSERRAGPCARGGFRPTVKSANAVASHRAVRAVVYRFKLASCPAECDFGNSLYEPAAEL